MTELILSQQNTRPPTGAPCVAVRGTAITTGASAATGAIKDTLAGTPPNRVRLAATAACYARLGTPAESTAKVSAANIGRKNMLGKKLSEETKAKIAASQKGVPKTPEHRKKIGDAIRAACAKRNALCH